jgi:hypothetical protein
MEVEHREPIVRVAVPLTTCFDAAEQCSSRDIINSWNKFIILEEFC